MIVRKPLEQILIGLSSGILILTACTSAGTSTPVSVTQSVTITPSSIPTNTSISTTTPTVTITPLPTIPTFTPTFDASTILTVTPAPKAECPQINTAIRPEDYLPEKIDYPSSNVADKILEFLNEGGNGQSLVRKLDEIYAKVEYSGGYDFLDVTGDQVSEFLYIELTYTERPIAFSCKNGKYEILDILSGQPDFDFYEMKFGHLNSDGIPEIIVIGTGGVSFPISTIYLYGWNGKRFSILGQVNILALRETQFRDIDGIGIKDIILIGDNPTCTSCSNFIPQRLKTIAYGWNGTNFVEISNEFTPPEYRFQAIQDADIAVIVGNYSKAVQLYSEAISNNALEWWSPERLTYEQHIANPVYMFIETP